MTQWRRLYITVEGHTERKFADDLLRPHLAQYEIAVYTRVVVTNRKLGKRGGVLDFKTIHGDLRRLMLEHADPEVRFTTMLDLYALPSEFPGWHEAHKQATPDGRVKALESALSTVIDDTRFVPYIQLHEFEALLFCDLHELQRRISGSDRSIAALKEEIGDLAPEAINEGASTAPSKRIIRHLPLYDRLKVRVGAPAAVAIGLHALRTKCPHFSAWVARLEELGRAPGV